MYRQGPVHSQLSKHDFMAAFGEFASWLTVPAPTYDKGYQLLWTV